MKKFQNRNVARRKLRRAQRENSRFHQLVKRKINKTATDDEKREFNFLIKKTVLSD
jgi:hypothetical protein